MVTISFVFTLFCGIFFYHAVLHECVNIEPLLSSVCYLRLSVNDFQNWQPEDLELADNQSKSFLLSWWDYIHKWPGEPVEKKKAVFGQCGDLINIHPCHCIEYLHLILPKLLLKNTFKQFSSPFFFSKSYQVSLLWHSCEGDISLLPCWLFKEGVNKVMTLEKVDNRFW